MSTHDARSILHITLRYPPAVGGVESYVGDIVRSLEDSSYRSHVLTTDLASHTTGVKLLEPCTEDGVTRLSARPLFGRWRYPRVDAGARSALAYARDAAIVHGHGFYYPGYDLALWAASVTRTPLVLSPYLYKRSQFPWKAYRHLHRLTDRAATTLVAVSHFEKSLIVGAGLAPPDRVRVIYPPVSQKATTTIRRPPTTSPTLLFLGRISRQKGALDVIDVLTHLSDAGLDANLIVAGADDGAEPEMRQRISELELSSRVRFLGRVTDTEKQELLLAADFLVLPTRYEAFGIVLAEAMANGCVPATYAVGATPEVLADGRAGLLSKSTRPAELADLIRALVSSPDRWASVVAFGRHHAEQNFGQEQWTNAWRSLYDDIA